MEVFVVVVVVGGFFFLKGHLCRIHFFQFQKQTGGGGAVLPVRQLNPATEQWVGIYSVNISHSLKHCLADYRQASCFSSE